MTRLSRRALLRGLAATAAAIILPRAGRSTAPEPEAQVDIPGVDAANLVALSERVERLCALIQRRDARFVSVRGSLYSAWQYDAITVIATIWSESCQEHLIAKMELSDEFVWDANPEICASICASSFLDELEQAESERLGRPAISDDVAAALLDGTIPLAGYIEQAVAKALNEKWDEIFLGDNAG